MSDETKPVEPTFNRAMRRKVGKLYHFKSEPMPRVNKGDCPVCELAVMVAPGQLFTMINKRPVHKICARTIR